MVGVPRSRVCRGEALKVGAGSPTRGVRPSGRLRGVTGSWSGPGRGVYARGPRAASSGVGAGLGRGSGLVALPTRAAAVSVLV